MTTTAGLWIPGCLTPTNEAISLARGDGYHHGYGRAMVERGAWRSLKRGDERYAEAARRTRLAAAAAARKVGFGNQVPWGDGERFRIRYSVQGHGRIDVAGAYLAAKWLEDGLVDAAVLRSDRFDVGEAVVTVVRDGPPAPGVYVSLERLP